MDRKHHGWPNGARIAVLVSLLLESWSPGKGPGYFPRSSALKPGSTDHGAIQWGGFGGNEGIFRLLGLLDRHAIPATVLCSARSVDLYPAALAAIAQSGQDVGAHGPAQDVILASLEPEAQRAAIRHSVAAIGQACGRRPEGWVSAAYGWDQHTADFLVQEGLRWHADALDTSLPRIQETPSGRIIAFPWSEFVDNRVLRGAPRDFLDSYRDGFDYLYESEPMSLLHIGLHSHTGGRPLIAAQIDRLLRHLKQFPEVWFVRHGELARTVAEGAVALPAPALRFAP
jgi:peptidoglycan/xylan/chitin deacetylase (PgdA/CDA1 family)